MLREYTIFDKPLKSLPNKKMMINTINAYSYVITKKDSLFKEALLNSDVLIPDGVGAVLGVRILSGKKIKKIAGADLFFYEMERLEKIKGKCFFLGSTNETLLKIKKRANKEYPNVIIEYFSPPYKPEFSLEENDIMIEKVNSFEPDVLFVGMTAPKQEKWTYTNFKVLKVGHVGSIGAVFDFYAGSVKRAPGFMISIGLEWFYRLIKEPRRMWRRYLIGNFKFVYFIIREKLFNNA
jgi:N-acetylglucosaminyldiphosphoundecaprenol N-acetyl-beta-D-mannosaminyltransferase